MNQDQYLESKMQVLYDILLISSYMEHASP